jgi:hypothetical protein
MRLFNSIQLAILFCIYPYILTWVLSAAFYGATVLFWVGVVGYFFSFACIVKSIYNSFGREQGWW